MKVEDLQAILDPKLPEGTEVCLTTGPLLGLGDHAVYSTLPERLSALGYNVYLDKDSVASNAEIYDLFWKMNPFIKGLSERKPNAGYENQGLFYEWANRLPGHRSIEAMEVAHGLPPPYGMAPKIYYEFKPHHLDLSNTVLVDFSAVSSKLARQRVIEFMRQMTGRFRNPPFLQVLHPSWVVVNQDRYLENAYAVSSIYEYLDMIKACRAWVGSESGGQSLASAVRGEHDVYEANIRPEVVVFSTRKTENSRGYCYKNADYFSTANDGDEDFHRPLEVDVLKYKNACMVRRVEMENRAARG